MKLLDFKKTYSGKYLKHYELCYENKEKHVKKYEMISRNEMNDSAQIGKKSSGVSIVAFVDGKLLLLKEFRMAVNQNVYNLCAGMFEENEDLESCIRRELAEETGLELKTVIKALKPSFGAVAISDVTTNIIFVKAAGEIHSGGSENEMITAGLYTKQEVQKLLEEDILFSSRAQIIAYLFTLGGFDQIL